MDDLQPELKFEDLTSEFERKKTKRRKLNDVEACSGTFSGDDNDYLGSSDLCSYETDSDGELACKKRRNVLFHTLTTIPKFHLGMSFNDSTQFKNSLAAYAIAKRVDIKYIKNEKFRTRASVNLLVVLFLYMLLRIVLMDFSRLRPLRNVL